MTPKELTLSRLTAEWVELFPVPGRSNWFLHTTHRAGNGEVTEDWWTVDQAEEIVRVAGQKP